MKTRNIKQVNKIEKQLNVVIIKSNQLANYKIDSQHHIQSLNACNYNFVWDQEAFKNFHYNVFIEAKIGNKSTEYEIKRNALHKIIMRFIIRIITILLKEFLMQTFF